MRSRRSSQPASVVRPSAATTTSAQIHGQHRGYHQPWIRGGEGRHQKHQCRQRKHDLQRADRAVFVGQLAAPDIPDRDRDAVHQHHQADARWREACDLLQDRRKVGKGDERAAVAERRNGVHQQQARLRQHGQLRHHARRLAVRDSRRHQRRAADDGDNTQQRHREKGGLPAEGLADEGAERDS